MINSLNQVKRENVPEIQPSSTSMEVPDCAESFHSDIAVHVPAVPVNVLSAILIPEIHEAHTHHDASFPTDCGIQSQSSSPWGEYLVRDTLFEQDHLNGTSGNKNCGSVAATRKRKIFNSSFLCQKRIAKLSPSDRKCLSGLIKLRANNLKEAMMLVHIPPFPTPHEMALKVLSKKSSVQTVPKLSSETVPLAKKPSIRKKSSLQTGAKRSSQKKAPKVARTRGNQRRCSEKALNAS